jgi:hypothetical protein
VEPFFFNDKGQRENDHRSGTIVAIETTVTIVTSEAKPETTQPNLKSKKTVFIKISVPLNRLPQ